MTTIIICDPDLRFDIYRGQPKEIPLRKGLGVLIRFGLCQVYPAMVTLIRLQTSSGQVSSHPRRVVDPHISQEHVANSIERSFHSRTVTTGRFGGSKYGSLNKQLGIRSTLGLKGVSNLYNTSRFIITLWILRISDTSEPNPKTLIHFLELDILSNDYADDNFKISARIT